MALEINVLETFSSLSNHETTQINRQFMEELNIAIFEASRQGVLLSSGAMAKFSRIAQSTLSMHSRSAMNTAFRCVENFGIDLDDPHVTELYDLVCREIDREMEYIINELENSPPFQRELDDPNRYIEEIQSDASSEKQRFKAELHLLAVRQNSQQTNSSHTEVNITGSVGVVQTGSGSIGNISQQFGQIEKENLLKALKNLSDSLANLENEHSVQTDDIAEMSDEATAELGKTKPNFTKLKSLVEGIGKVIAFVPKLKDAYDVLKPAAAALGTTLP